MTNQIFKQPQTADLSKNCRQKPPLGLLILWMAFSYIAATLVAPADPTSVGLQYVMACFTFFATAFLVSGTGWAVRWLAVLCGAVVILLWTAPSYCLALLGVEQIQPDKSLPGSDDSGLLILQTLITVTLVANSLFAIQIVKRMPEPKAVFLMAAFITHLVAFLLLSGLIIAFTPLIVQLIFHRYRSEVVT